MNYYNIYFYSRVSTIGQNSNRQLENFKLLDGFSTDNLFVDKVQGNIPFLKRPEASRLFEEITNHSKQSKITVVVDSVDRLGRSLLDILNTIKLFSENCINLKCLKEGFETLIEHQKINPTAMLVLSVMGSIAEMERNRIKERTSEGIAIAKSLGKYKGRKLGTSLSDDAILEKYPLMIKKISKGLAIREVAKIFNCSTATVQKVKKVMKVKSLF
jgi:DNA invertase Pin-like site-specific DNA recombinase